MPIRKTERPPEGAGTHKARLMDHQDRTKGDGTRSPSVLMTFRMPVDMRERLLEYSATTHVPMTTLVIEGLNWRLKQEQ